MARQDAFLFENISFSLPEMILSYLLIISVVLFWGRPRTNRLLQMMTSLVLFFGIVVVKDTTSTKEELVLFHRSRMSLIGHNSKQKLTLYRSDTVDRDHQYPIKDYCIGNRVRTIQHKSLPNVFVFKGKTVIRLDSLGVYPSIREPIVVLTFSPKVHLDRLIDSLSPKLIIADGSNYKSYVVRWKETCQNRKLPFHYTGEKGAYIFQ